MPYGSISVDKIENSDGFTLGGSGAAMKNRIINGNMAIAQRTTSAVTTDESFPVDRFQIQIVNSNLSLVQSSTAPAGFNYSTAITVTSTTSTNTNDRSRFFQNIEGFNVADLGWGTANAKTITVSFWARSTVAGTYSGNITNSTGARSYIFTYTLAANTWTYVTATVAGDTSGTWGATNGTGICVAPITLNCGATYQGTAGTWIAGDARGTSGSTYLATNNSGAVFNITGVQLEVGSTATSFDYRPYGTELALCQRYFQKSFSQSTAPANGSNDSSFQWSSGGAYNAITSQLKVTMRATPTNTFYNPRVGGTAGYCTDQTSDYTVRNSNWNDSFVGIDTYPQGTLTNKTLYVMWTSSAEL
jgi:hypothetical protein